MISTSQKDGGTTEWRGKADGTYSVRKIETDTREPGTQVYLRLRAGLEDHPECEDVEYLINTLKKIWFLFGKQYNSRNEWFRGRN